MYSNDHLYQGIDNDTKTFFCIYIISIVFHLIFISALLFAPDFTLHNKPLPSVISVSLVSLPEKKILPKSVRSKRIDSKSSTKLAVNTVKKSAKAIPLGKKKKRVKKSLKKRTYKAEEIRKKALKEKALKEKAVKEKALKEKALQQIEQKVAKAESDSLAEAFDRLGEEVKKEDAEKRKNAKFESNAKAALIATYLYNVEKQISKNWACSKQLAGGRTDLEVVMLFKIMPDGEIRDLMYETRSGNAYFDKSIKNAIFKSNPVSPHPKGINQSIMPFRLIRRSEDIN